MSRYLTGKKLNRSRLVIDNKFAYNVALEIIYENDDQEPKSIEQCRSMHDWPKWKDAIQEELNSLAKREVLGPIVQTPKGVTPVGYKWIFVQK